MAGLSPDMIARRDKAAARHDRALERFPDRSGPGFVAEIEAVIEELTAVCNAVDPTSSGDAEASRCFAWLADACFDRGQGKDRVWLEKGRGHYLRAEAILGPLTAATLQQHAKLDYNFANTLRGLSQGNDVPLLREAEARYRAALDVFRKHTPNLIGPAETQLATTTQQRQLAELLAKGHGELDVLQQIQKQLKDGDAARAEEAFKEHQATATPIDSYVQGLTQQLPQMAATLGLAEQDFAPMQQELRSSMAALGMGASPEMTAMFGMVKARYQADVAAGKLTPERQARVEHVLAQLEDLLAEQPHDDMTAMAAWSQRMRGLMEAFVAATTGAAAAGAMGCYQRLRKVVVEEEQQPQRLSGESGATRDIFVELAKLQEPLTQADPHRQAELERERLRPLAQQWRRYALRHHLLLTWPNRWLRDTVQVDPNGVAWFGGPSHREAVSKLCQERGLHLLDSSALDPTHGAWTTVRSAAVVIVELQGPRTAWSEACYTLGLAAATGTPHVVLLPAGTAPPFNLDIPVVTVDSSTALSAQLSERLDAALYDRRAFDANDSTLAATLAQARQFFHDGLASTLFQTLRGDDAQDPVRVRALLAQAAGVAGSSAPLISAPAFPVPYPDPQRPSCFHVTQFDRPGETRFKPVADAIRAACQAAGVEYLHGNEAQDRRILRAIWNDIGRSAHVVVDLSQRNPNVAYELAVAHALGRQVLAIGEAGTQDQLFPSIAKERLTQYDPQNPATTLAAAMRTFFEAP